MRLVVAILAAALGLCAQAPESQPEIDAALPEAPGIFEQNGPSPEAILLDHFVNRMRDHIGRQPDYTCVETVERTTRTAGGATLVEDTLHLEVALVDDKEMFSWPGANAFEDVTPTELVSDGMFGNGNFALYFRILFDEAGPAFHYEGEKVLNGVRVARYDFRVHQPASRYQLSVGGKRAFIGYYGSVYVSVGAADLRRLEIFGDEIPETLFVTSTSDLVDYEEIKIGEEYSLLPMESNLTMASTQLVSHNRVRFTGCRKFTGHSELIFVDPEFFDSAPDPVPVREAEMPAGARIPLVVTSRLDLEDGFVGQAVEARLESDVKHDGRKIAPKGAVAKGRVVRLQRMRGYFVLKIQWSDLEWRGGHAPLKLEFDSVGLPVYARHILRGVEGNIDVSRTGGHAMDDILTFWSVAK